jgi:hypothetical protein
MAAYVVVKEVTHADVVYAPGSLIEPGETIARLLLEAGAIAVQEPEAPAQKPRPRRAE